MAQEPIEVTLKCNLTVQKDCTDFIKTLSAALGYQEFIPDRNKPDQNIANPLTRKEFIEQRLVELLLQWGGDFEQQESIKAAPDKRSEFRDKYAKPRRASRQGVRR
jgi:hypothetical protein